MPDWVISRRGVGGKIPWWVPDEYEDGRELTCRVCGDATPVADILTPARLEGTVICEACWEDPDTRPDGI